MKEIINLNLVKTYSKDVGFIICENFFAKKEYISGKEIIELTTIPQVNLFIVKEIFESWQKESSKLKSPFFDYSEPDIVNGINALLSLLSKHIKVSRENFEPILEKAIYQTLLINFSPKTFFVELLTPLPSIINTEEDLSALEKYIKTHQESKYIILEKLELATDVAGQITKSKALEICQSVNYAESNETYAHTINLFSEYKPLDIDQLFPDFNNSTPSTGLTLDEVGFDSEDIEIDERVKNRSLLFDTSIEEVEEFGKQAPSEEDTPYDYPVESQEETAESEEAIYSNFEKILFSDSSETSTSPSFSFEDKTADENTDSSNFIAPTNSVVAEEPLQFDNDEYNDDVDETEEYDHFEDPISDEDKYEEEELEDETASEEPEQNSIFETLRNNQSKDIRDQLQLGERLIFQKELFNGNPAELEDALNIIDQATDYHTAIDTLKEKYIVKYDWDLSEKSTGDFLKLVDTKFDE